MPGILTLNFALFAIWLVSYIVALTLFLLWARAFSRAFRRVILSFNSRAIGNRQPLSHSEELAYTRAERLNRRWKLAFAAVSVLFLLGVILTYVLPFEGLLRGFATIAPGTLFFAAVYVALDAFAKVEQFEEAIRSERYNPARAVEFS